MAPMDRDKEKREKFFYGGETEIELGAIFALLWYRKWVFLSVISISVLVAIVYIMVSVPIYRIVGQLRPGITRFDSRQNPVSGWNAVDLKTLLGKSVDWEALFGYSNEGGKVNPKIEVETAREGSLVNVSFFWPDPREGSHLLEKALMRLRTQLREKSPEIIFYTKVLENHLNKALKDKEHVAIEKKRINDTISKKQAKIEALEEELELIQNNLQATGLLLNELSQQSKAVTKNTEELLAEKNKLIASKLHNDLALLIYLNTVQQNIAFLTSLESKIWNIKKETTRYILDAARKKLAISSLKMDIADLIVRRDKELAAKEENIARRIESLKAKESSLNVVEVVGTPTSSSDPVKPQRKFLIGLGLLTGGILGFLIVLILPFRKEVD